MSGKIKIKGLFSKISGLSGRNFINDSKKAIKQVPEILDQGLAQTASDIMKEIIEACEKKNKASDNELNWIYAMACCMYSYSFCRFGRKVDETYLNKTQEIANNNDFNDVLIWINICKLNNMMISGRTGHFQETADRILEILENLEDKEVFKQFLLPILIMNAINNGDFELSNHKANELISNASKLKNVNFEIQGNVLLGKILLESGKPQEAVKYIDKGISLGKDEHWEQLILAFHAKTESLLKEDNLSEAKVHLEEAKKKLDESLELIDTYYHIKMERLYGLLLKEEKKFKEAEVHYNQALKISQKIESPLEEGITHLKVGELLLKSEDFDRASISLEEASGKFIIINNQFMLSQAKKTRDLLELNKGKLTSSDAVETEPKKTGIGSFQTKALDDFMKVAITNLDLDSVLKNVIEHIMRVTDADRGFIVLIDKNAQLYSHVMRTKKKSDEKNAELIKKFSRSITERVLRTRQSILVNDIKDDQTFATAQSIVGLDIRSAVCVPLTVDKKDIIGLIYIDRQAFVGAFTEDDQALLESLAGYAAIAVSNARLHSGVQQKLETTQEQLIQSEKMATIGTLAGGVAHEINTPLGAILNNAEMLMLDSMSDEQKESLELIKQSTMKCKTIVEQLLKYSRKSDLETESSNINSVIKDACIILEHQFDNDGVEIVKDLSETPKLKCNPTELSQVITNLLLNAKDAIIERKVTPNNLGIIKIRAFLDNNMINVSVTDNGCGIPPENLKKIYDPFFTTKEVGKGTGLGLSIVQKILDRHGGRIEITSEPGKGTTILLKFII